MYKVEYQEEEKYSECINTGLCTRMPKNMDLEWAREKTPDYKNWKDN
jgi:hypothetical protein